MINVNISILDGAPRPVSLATGATLQDLLNKTTDSPSLIYKRNGQPISRTAPLLEGDHIFGVPENTKGGIG